MKIMVYDFFFLQTNQMINRRDVIRFIINYFSLCQKTSHKYKLFMIILLYLIKELILYTNKYTIAWV